MNRTEVLILFIAVAADTFTTSFFSGALHKKLALHLDVKLPLVFAAVRLVFAALGFMFGIFAAGFAAGFFLTAGLILIAAIGIKMGVESYLFNPEEKVFLLDNLKTMIFLALAGGFNTFFVAAGAGLMGIAYNLPLIITAFSVAGFSVFGKFAGTRAGFRPGARFVGLVSGIVVLAIALNHLIRHF